MRRSRRKSPKLVTFPNPNDVPTLLGEALQRAEEGETIAVALVEYKRGGDVDCNEAGMNRGFRHALVAGTVYLLDLLKGED